MKSDPMSSGYSTVRVDDDSEKFRIESNSPGIVVAYSPQVSLPVDRCRISEKFLVGRGSDCELSINEASISRRHFQILLEEDQFYLEDLNSTNGTYLNGKLVRGRKLLDDQDVIRSGRMIFVFHENITPLLPTSLPDHHHIEGRFHAAVLLEELREVSISQRHVLLSGSSGTGKELAAHALIEMIRKHHEVKNVVVHNAARFASQEEAEATLFGVAKRFFSNVDARPGLIEQADGGVLFIDEIHSMPINIQRSLLRVIENAETTRLGETETRPVRVRFILATNAEGDTKGLGHDLFARLRLVEILPLNKRISDIPSIFNSILVQTAKSSDYINDPNVIVNDLKAAHYEAMMFDGFPMSNIRGLVDLADRVITRISAGVPPGDAIAAIFGE